MLPSSTSSSFKDASLYQSPGSKCKPCPVVHPVPVCGSDGHTYSSQVPSPSSHQLHRKLCCELISIFFPCPCSASWNTSRASRAKRSRSSVRGCVPALLRLSPAPQRRKVPGSAHCTLSPNWVESAPNWCSYQAEISFSHVCCSLLPRRWLHFLIHTLNPDFTEGNNSARGLYLPPRQCCDLSQNINFNTVVSASVFTVFPRFGGCAGPEPAIPMASSTTF